MKKVVKILSCLIICFSLTGCFSNIYSRTANNEIETVCDECSDVTNIEHLVDNIKIMMGKVKAISGTYELTNTKQTFEITFDAITKDKRINWDLYAKTIYDDKEVNIYFKNQKFYIIYPNNGANVIMKDNITNLVSEAEESLEKLKATYNKDNLEELLTGQKLAGFNFDGMVESGSYQSNGDGSYTIRYEENSLLWEYDISSNYLITETRCQAINFNSVLVFEYPEEVTITYPMGLDFLTLNIKDVKRLLEIESFAELIDESLKKDNTNK